jgi:hypothetical protein
MRGIQGFLPGTSDQTKMNRKYASFYAILAEIYHLRLAKVTKSHVIVFGCPLLKI